MNVLFFILVNANTSYRLSKITAKVPEIFFYFFIFDEFRPVTELNTERPSQYA